MGTGASRPPRLLRWLLGWTTPRDRRAERESDLDELFEQRARERNVSYARRRYLLDALSLITRWRSRAERQPRPRTIHWRIEPMFQDVRFALRMFRRQAGVMSLAVIGLALAIGANTAAFSFVNALQLRALGVPDADSVVHAHQRYGGQGTNYEWEYADYLLLRDRARLLRAEAWLTAWVRVAESAAAAAETVRPVQAALVSGRFFETLGGRARIGRVLNPADDGPAAARVAVLSYVYWRSRFGADPGIVGRNIFLSGAPVTIVGVADPAFTGPFEIPPVIWQPLGSAHAVVGWLEPFSPASRQRVRVLGRLTDRHGAAAAQAEATGILTAAHAIAATSSTAAGRTSRLSEVTLNPASVGRDGDSVAISLLVLGVVSLVVLLACTNVANLLLASATSRQYEIAARLALGASRGRLVRQLLTESVLLSLAAGALGLAISVQAVPAIAALVQAPEGVDLAPDLRVLTFTLTLALIAGVAAGLAPARYGTRGDVLTPLKGGARNRRRPGRTRGIFVGVQAAVSMLLLVLAALFGRAVVHTSSLDLGFDPSKFLVAQPGLTRSDPQGVRTGALLDAAVARAASLPGVDATAIALFQPFVGGYIPLRGLPGDTSHLVVHQNRTSAEYFRVIGLTLVRGRTYTAAEVREVAPVAVISARLARDLWADEDPLGRSLERLQAAPQQGLPDLSQIRVIGIVNDAFTSRLKPEQMDARQLYLPLEKDDINGAAHLLVRTREAASIVARPIQQAVQSIDPGIRLNWSLSSENLDRSLAPVRRLWTLTGILSGLALALAVVGLFGATATAVSQRLTEVSLRIAIGATARDIRRLLLRDSLRPVAIGLAAGLALALASGQFLAVVLYGVSPRDPLAMTSAAALLASSAALAVLIPARRAARVDPVRLLRQI